jgi:hypothetical protein
MTKQLKFAFDRGIGCSIGATRENRQTAFDAGGFQRRDSALSGKILGESVHFIRRLAWSEFPG